MYGTLMLGLTNCLILHEFLGDLTKTNSSTKRLGMHGVVAIKELGKVLIFISIQLCLIMVVVMWERN